MSLLLCRIVKVLPMMMNASASKSYFTENFSPRKQMAKRALETMAVAELQDRRTMSAKG